MKECYVFKFNELDHGFRVMITRLVESRWKWAVRTSFIEWDLHLLSDDAVRRSFNQVWLSEKITVRNQVWLSKEIIRFNKYLTEHVPNKEDITIAIHYDWELGSNNSIWSTVEGQCMCEGWEYVHYLKMHTERGCVGTPLTEPQYTRLGEVYRSVLQ